MNFTFSFIFLFSMCSSALLHAEDIGVRGDVWEITEVDIRQLFLQDAHDVDWEKKNQELTKSVENKVDNPDPFNLPHASKTETHYVDPSIVSSREHKALIRQDDGSFKWEVIVKKGHKENPLTKVRPPQNMFFFDGRDKRQVEFAKAMMMEFKMRILPVQTAGAYKKLSEEVNLPIYYADENLLQKLQIKAVPSMAGVGTGWHKYHFAVTEFSEDDFNVATAKEAWNGLLQKAK
jgi:conjugal transfer pilus assembly protein TraW